VAQLLKLTKLRAVALVDSPANPSASIEFFKHEDGMSDNKDTGDVSAVSERIDQLEEKQEGFFTKVLNALKGKETEAEDQTDDSNEVAKRDEQIAKLSADLDKLQKREDARQRDAAIAKAETLGLAGDDHDLVTKVYAGLDDKESKKLDEVFKARTNAIEKAGLTKATGSDQTSDEASGAWDKITALAKAEKEGTHQQRIAKVLETDEGARLMREYYENEHSQEGGE